MQLGLAPALASLQLRDTMILVTLTRHSDTSDIQNNAHDTFTLHINTQIFSYVAV